MHKLLIAFFKHGYHEVTSMNGGILLIQDKHNLWPVNS